MPTTSESSAPEPSALTRRDALKVGAGAAAGVSLLPQLSPGAAGADEIADSAAGHQVFQHGIASGDPWPDSVILWTRATSHPEDLPGMEAGQPVDLHWEVALDEAFTALVTSGPAQARPEHDNTVRVEATGLSPRTRYFYRFTVTSGAHIGQSSPIGRTLTAPAADEDLQRMRIALFSCAYYEAGYFTAYQDMAARGDIDLALHVGDYIYENESDDSYSNAGDPVRTWLPTHEIVSLSDYRQRYGTYRTDPDLQAAHAAVPWMVTWDDHEITDNTWAGGANNHQPDTEGDYLTRRDNATQAYLEWLPMRAVAFSEGGHLYRGARFGRLADVSMLDLRTYRSEQLSLTSARATDNPGRTMMGSEQFQWLADRLTSSDTHWNIIGNSVMIAPLLVMALEPRTTKALTELLGIPEQGLGPSQDQWDGYAAERRRLFDLLRSGGIDNAVFLTGDIHTSWANDLPYNPANYPGEGIVGLEVVGTSVTSTNVDDALRLPPGSFPSQRSVNALRTMNHHMRYIDLDWHGYSVIEVEPGWVHVDWVYVNNKRVPDSGTFVGKSMFAQRGQGWSDAAVALNPADHTPGA